MKKLLFLLLAVVYLSITSGVLVNIHYCMGEKSSVSYGVDKDDHCGKCGMKDKNGCCHTEHKLLKVQDEHLFAKLASQLAEPSILSIRETGFVLPSAPDQFLSSLFPYHSPPDPRANTLRIFNGVFRI